MNEEILNILIRTDEGRDDLAQIVVYGPAAAGARIANTVVEGGMMDGVLPGRIAFEVMATLDARDEFVVELAPVEWDGCEADAFLLIDVDEEFARCELNGESVAEFRA